MRKAGKRLLIVLFAIVISTTVGYAQAINCSSNQIQSQLDSGKSVYDILSACSSLQLSEFYGKNFAGGVIVYLDSSRNGTGIVAATEDENSYVSWYNRLSQNGGSFNSGLQEGLGTGLNNMRVACAQSGCGKPPKSPYPNYNSPNQDALYFVSSSNRNGYSDWYLPSKEELSTAYTNVSSNFSSCSNGGWWTSSQIPASYTFPGANFTFYQYKNYYPYSVYLLNNNGQITWSSKDDGRCARSFRSFGPWIDSDNNTEVEAGAAMSIKGSNFDPTPANNTIQFPNGITANPHESTSSLMTVIVPPGTHDGEIRVVVDGVQSNALQFEIGQQPSGNPVVSSFSESVIVVGNNFQSDTKMTVYGENFSLYNTVTFAGGAQSVSDASSNQTSFNVTIPPNALTGPITVTSSVGHSEPSSDSLFVLEYSTPATALTLGDLNDVAISDDKEYIVAVGKQGKIVVSENGGSHWYDSTYVNPDFRGVPQSSMAQLASNFRSAVGNSNLHSIAYRNINSTEIFYIWGEFNSAYNSNDFVQLYTLKTSIAGWAGDANNDEISDPFVVGSDLLAVKGRSRGGDIVKYQGSTSSTNRVFQWSTLQSGVTEIYDFASNQNSIITVGQNTSSNKTYWFSSIPPSTTSWSAQSTSLQMIGATWADNLFVAVGYLPSNTQRSLTINYSSDGKSWTSAICNNGGCGVPQTSVAYNKELDLFFSGGHMLTHYYSKDGKNWASISLPSNFGTHVTQINKIVPSDDGFIVVGNGGLIGVLKAKRPAH